MNREHSTQRAQVREHVARLRDALGLDAPLPHLAAMRAEAPLFVGGKTRKSTQQTAEGVAGRENRPRTRLEDPLIRALDPGYFEALPDELLVEILEHTLFPTDLLHLNQIRAQGGKERRTRMHYEMDLIHGIIKYRDAFRELARIPKLSPILRDPYLRRRLYKRWLMTPIEGLYEDLVSDGLSQARDSQQVDDLKIRAFYADESLPLSWYGDAFLATVVANEWKHALTMSTARAFQFLAWRYYRLRGDSDTTKRSRFVEYWRLPEFGTARMDDFLQKTLTEVFTSERFPLTFYEDHTLMVGDIEGMGIVPYQFFQGWSQDQLKSAAAMLPDAQTRRQYNLGDPELRTLITTTVSVRVPRTAQLLLYFAQSNIEVMRISSFYGRFAQYPVAGIRSHVFAAGSYFPKLWFAPERPDLHETHPVLFFNWPTNMYYGAPLSNGKRSGFTPWYTPIWHLRLGGIRVENGSRLKKIIPLLSDTSPDEDGPQLSGDEEYMTNEIALRRPYAQATVDALTYAIWFHHREWTVEIVTDTMTH